MQIMARTKFWQKVIFYHLVVPIVNNACGWGTHCYLMNTVFDFSFILHIILFISFFPTHFRYFWKKYQAIESFWKFDGGRRSRVVKDIWNAVKVYLYRGLYLSGHLLHSNASPFSRRPRLNHSWSMKCLRE